MYVNPAMVEHVSSPPEVAKSGSDFEMVKKIITSWHLAFPDSKTTILNIIAEGNMLTVHSRYEGTNTGPFFGVPATNKKVDFEQVDLMRFDAAGKAIEHWGVFDQMIMLQQLGLIPDNGK